MAPPGDQMPMLLSLWVRRGTHRTRDLAWFAQPGTVGETLEAEKSWNEFEDKLKVVAHEAREARRDVGEATKLWRNFGRTIARSESTSECFEGSRA